MRGVIEEIRKQHGSDARRNVTPHCTQLDLLGARGVGGGGKEGDSWRTSCKRDRAHGPARVARKRVTSEREREYIAGKGGGKGGAGGGAAHQRT